MKLYVESSWCTSVGLTPTIWCDAIIFDEIVFLRFLRIKSDFYQRIKSKIGELQWLPPPQPI